MPNVEEFNAIARLLLDEGVSDSELRARAFALAGSEGDLREAFADSERLLRPLDDNYYDFFAEKYDYIRQFAPGVLGALSFRSNRWDDPILDVVSLLREIDANGIRRVPHGAPLGFVPAGWQPCVLAGPGRIDRHKPLRQVRNRHGRRPGRRRAGGRVRPQALTSRVASPPPPPDRPRGADVKDYEGRCRLPVYYRCTGWGGSRPASAA